MDGVTVLNCSDFTEDTTDYILKLPQWCSTSDSVTPCGASSSLNIQLVNSRNPAWIVSPLTSSVKVQTLNIYNTNEVIIDEILTGV